MTKTHLAAIIMTVLMTAVDKTEGKSLIRVMLAT